MGLIIPTDFQNDIITGRPISAEYLNLLGTAINKNTEDITDRVTMEKFEEVYEEFTQALDNTVLAEPPEEIELAFSTHITGHRTSSLYKSPLGIVYLQFGCGKTPVGFSTGMHIATLPVGYRPRRINEVLLAYNPQIPTAIGTVTINPNVNILTGIENHSASQFTTACISFLAA